MFSFDFSDIGSVTSSCAAEREAGESDESDSDDEEEVREEVREEDRTREEVREEVREEDRAREEAMHACELGTRFPLFFMALHRSSLHHTPASTGGSRAREQSEEGLC